ncbi:MAG: hypothetical protein ABR591_11980 [Candidatus Velthaea sp.]
MSSEAQADKVEAIYKLREAAERKARAEHIAERDSSPTAKHALLDAKLTLEAKTQDAIEACHECEHEHGGDQPHNARRSRVEQRRDNVLGVDFRPPSERQER